MTDDGELERLVAEQAADLEWLHQVEHQYPLAVAALWEAPGSPCDQRRSVIAAATAPTVCVVNGGERSGKSTGAGRQLAVASALGSDHPMVRAWLELNRLPADLVPRGPSEVYAVALTSSDSMRYHRPQIDQLLPRWGKRWYNQNGKGEAHVEMSVPGYSLPGKIWFKSIDQGPDSMQGHSVRFAWIDEDPVGELGRLVYGQLRARVADQDGRVAITRVPMHGPTWVETDLVRDRKDDAVVVELDTLDNPYLPRARFERHFGGMDDSEVQLRRFGRAQITSGRIYPMFSEGDLARFGPSHVCEPFPIPDDWVRFRMGDFGLVNPTCVLWAALGDDDTLYVYDEYYVPNGESYAWHTEQVRQRELDHGCVYEGGWGDPSSKEAREEFARAGIWFAAGNNDYAGGYDKVRERLRLQGDNRPRLKVFARNCPNLVRELRGLCWDPNRVDKVQKKVDDHAPDALRYGVLGIESWKGL